MRLTVRTVLAVVALAAAVTLTVPTLRAQQDVHRTMYVSVLNQAGKPVSGLTARDFTVYEDRIPREVLEAGPATDPSDIAILVDTSQAAAPYVQDIRPAVAEFARAMATGGNRVAIISFGDRPTIVVDYTTDPERLEQGAQRLFAAPDSGAYLLDAIVETAHGLAKRPISRAVIVGITTEGTEFSNAAATTVTQAVQAAGATLDLLSFGPTATNLMNPPARERALVFDRSTKETGGRFDHILTGMALSQTLTQIGDDLTHQYRIVYAHPETLIPPKTFSVSVDRPGLSARGTPLRSSRRP
ncbi:MAG: VWA domain-containing protein [Acidobacteriota bacterium]|nr:VWA domain-containing protein [Acidobacteriota bacterium]